MSLWNKIGIVVTDAIANSNPHNQAIEERGWQRKAEREAREDRERHGADERAKRERAMRER